jgi:hypothetical protein
MSEKQMSYRHALHLIREARFGCTYTPELRAAIEVVGRNRERYPDADDAHVEDPRECLRWEFGR